jgi:lipoyl(octanoyl) transferase
VAATGVRATRWVTYHGIALNITVDLSPFKDIIPCGINDKPVTSVQELLDGEHQTSVATEPSRHPLLAEYSYAIQEAFQAEFAVEFSRSSNKL